MSERTLETAVGDLRYHMQLLFLGMIDSTRLCLDSEGDLKSFFRLISPGRSPYTNFYRSLLS